MQEPLKNYLDWMVGIDIIKKEEDATPWVSNVLCTPNGDIRVIKLQGCKYFSALDQSSGYWNMEVHPDSVPLLTLNTPFGRYAYKGFYLGL